MKNAVSKIRAQKTKTREKQAIKAGSSNTPLHKSRLIGFLIVLILWSLAILASGIEHIVQPSQKLETLLFSMASNGVFLLVALFAVGIFIEALNPGFTKQNSKILLVSMISAISILPAGVIFYMTRTGLIKPDIAPFFMPFAMAPMLATILFDRKIGIAIGVWTCLVIAIILGKNFPLFITGMTVTVLAAQAIHGVRTRTKVLKIGLVTGLAEIPCVLALTISHGINSDVLTVIMQASACIIGGFISAILTLLILPLFESLFHITTDITLLELSDMGHPLLQRLAIEAPGTYHHSLIVANLAQAAAHEIGANSLAARVCSYFHDIGKLTKPEFFIENIQLQFNPHDDLPPSMSTLVIIAHVKEGLSLAMLHKLPEPVLRVIREHHGTGLLSYLHHKAKSQLEFQLTQENPAQSSDGQTKINESDFRYPGPKPSSRESAVICLADAVEAASRSMEKTTPVHIEGLINEIINTRFLDGQFDNCDLAISDLTTIKRSFLFSMTSMFHSRVPYPKDENRDKQQAKAGQTEQT